MTGNALEESAARALILAWQPAWAERMTACQWLPGGYSNSTWQVHLRADGSEPAAMLAIRLVQVTAVPPVDRQRELRLLRLAAGLAPEVVAFDTGTGHMATRWIDGSVLADQPDPASAACVLRALAALPAAVGPAYCPVARSRRALASAGLQVPAAWLPPPAPPGPRPLCHNDLNPWNVLLPKVGTVRLLDWEWAAPGWPVFDLVNLGLGLGLDNQGLVALADAAGLVLAPGDLALARHQFCLREYAWAEQQLSLGNRRPEIEAQRDRERALLPGLASG